MHNTESKFGFRTIKTILFAGMYVSTFQPGNFTGWDSEGVKFAWRDDGLIGVRTANHTVTTF